MKHRTKARRGKLAERRRRWRAHHTIFFEPRVYHIDELASIMRHQRGGSGANSNGLGRVDSILDVNIVTCDPAPFWTIQGVFNAANKRAYEKWLAGGSKP